MSVKSYKLANGQTRWKYRVDLPAGDEGRRQKYAGGFLTEQAAREAEAEVVRKHGRTEASARGTVGAALRAWVEICKIDLKVTTAAWYGSVVETYVIPHLGDLAMTSLDEARLNKLYRYLLTRGSSKGVGLSASTVRSVHKTLSAALHDLKVKLDWEEVRVPRPKRGTGRHGVWTEAQSAAFLTHTREDPLFAAWALAVVCGMRRGELAGLRWSYVDLEEGVVRVRRQRTLANGTGVVEDDPKGTSERDIPVGALMVGVLTVWRGIWDRMRAEAGDRWQGGDMVFVYDRGRTRGRPYHPSYFTHRFPNLCDAAGVPRIALHDARHTSATVSSANGVDIKTLQARMGHADTKVLTEIYLHLVTPAGRAAAQTIEAAMLRRAAVHVA